MNADLHLFYLMECEYVAAKSAREWAIQCGPGLVFSTEGP